MARRKTQNDQSDSKTQEQGEHAGPKGSRQSRERKRTGAVEGLRGARLLCVGASRLARERLDGAFEGRVQSLAHAGSGEHAIRLAQAGAFDLVLVEEQLSDMPGSELIERLSRERCACVLASESESMDAAVEAMRVGAIDLLSIESTTREMVERVEAILSRARGIRRREMISQRRVERLRRLCRELNRSRHELQARVQSLSGDLANVQADAQSKLQQSTLASEFNTIVRQELDVEGLLRTVLEYVLPRIGPTNAAVFLPSSSGDYALGAYVNYDIPKDSAELLLETLAGVIAPTFERESDVVFMPTLNDLEHRLGEDAYWLENSGAVVFSCCHEGECLAVVTLFRDRMTPFPEGLMPTLRTVRDLFAAQLGRVIRTHHRHLPKHKWGHLGDDAQDTGGDDIDLAA